MHPIVRPALRAIILTIASWCLMLLTHELGHVVGGWLGGGKLKAVELRPWHLPYSLFEPDPQPLLTLWSGLMSGVALPLVLAIAIRSNWSWLIAGFCMLANGLYIAVGWWSGDSFLDTTQLLQHGAYPISIILYCVVTIGVGYTLFRRSVTAELKTAKSNR